MKNRTAEHQREAAKVEYGTLSIYRERGFDKKLYEINTELGYPNSNRKEHSLPDNITVAELESKDSRFRKSKDKRKWV